jgi:hypothetical protein
MPIGQHQNLSVTFGPGLEQLIAPKQPDGHQVGRSTVCDPFDRTDHSVPIYWFLQRNHDLRGIVEHNKGKQIVRAQIANDGSTGLA